MVRSFSAWKAWAIVKLTEIRRKYAGNPKVTQAVDVLVNRLERLRLDSLAPFLADLHRASTDVPEFLEIFPREEEVAEWFQGGGEE
jgi:hypothetical protein